MKNFKIYFAVFKKKINRYDLYFILYTSSISSKSTDQLGQITLYITARLNSIFYHITYLYYY